MRRVVKIHPLPDVVGGGKGAKAPALAGAANAARRAASASGHSPALMFALDDLPGPAPADAGLTKEVEEVEAKLAKLLAPADTLEREVSAPAWQLAPPAVPCCTRLW